ncbi:MAG: DUF2125 domain-containing protein [Pseudomonadota bacterium]
MVKAKRQKSSGAWIAVPFIIAVLLVAAYTAYWYYARGILENGIDQWIDQQRAQGLTVEYNSRELGGYPFRFALTVESPMIGQPAGGPEWSADQLELIMQPWDWYHVIARSPGRNTFVLGPEEGDDLRVLLGRRSAASLRWDSTSVTRFSLALDEASLAAGGEPVGELDDFEFHIRPAPGVPDLLQLETHWQRVELSETPPDNLALLGRSIGPSILRVELDGGVSALAETGDLAEAIELALSRGGELLFPQLMLEWGPASLGARADLRREAGELRGNAGVRIERADELRAALAAEGLLTDETRLAIDGLEAASADGGFFPATLRGDGIYFLGQKQIDFPLEDLL